MYKILNKETGIFTNLIHTTDKLICPDVYKQEASVKNHTLLVYFSKYALYQRNDCGHLVVAEITNMRHQKRSFCKECSSNRLKEVLIKKDVTFLSYKSSTESRIRVNKCNHEFNVVTHNLYKTDKPFFCIECFKIELQEECEKKGLTLVSNDCSFLDNPRKSRFSTFRWNKCGHEFHCPRHSLKSQSNCAECYRINKEKKLKDMGFTYISSTGVRTRNVYRFNSCGHIFEAYESAALRGNCKCSVCNESSYDKPSNLYIIRFTTDDSFQFLKFGYGKDIANRLREYKLAGISSYEILYDCGVATGRLAQKVEKAIHTKMKDGRLASDIARKYLTYQGYSECYPLEALESLKGELYKRGYL